MGFKTGYVPHIQRINVDVGDPVILIGFALLQMVADQRVHGNGVGLIGILGDLRIAQERIVRLPAVLP